MSSDTARTILEQSQAAQRAISISMDGLWGRLLNSPLYDTVARFGSWCAVGTIALFVVLWVRDYLQDEMALVPWEKWFWLFLAVCLLHDKGELTKQTTLALRDILNNVNLQVLSATEQRSATLMDAYQQATTALGVQGWYEQELNRCRSVVDTDNRQRCIRQALDTANELAVRGAPDGRPNWWQRLGNSVGETNPLGISLNLLETSFIGIVLALGVAVQWMVEVTWVLMGMAAPLAVGGMLLPVRQKSLFAWAIGFYSVGLYKLFFNLLIGMVAMVQVGAGSFNSVVFAVATGLLAPVLAGVLAAGGGMATLMSLGSVVAAVAGKSAGGVTVAGKAIGGTTLRLGRAAGARGVEAFSSAWRKRVRPSGGAGS